jgi:hypothetical protein
MAMYQAVGYAFLCSKCILKAAEFNSGENGEGRADQEKQFEEIAGSK